ncbi:MAG: glutamate-5-semialdehyde dehydrogenase [Clostridia bacterium]|nr:glutamate-5-semialdehyde dehydrogenase [Clostridia bacterium]
MRELLEQAQKHTSIAATLTYDEKQRALCAMADCLILHQEEILLENQKDMEAANEIGDVMKDRLRLSEERIVSMAEGIRRVAKLPDPVGRVLEERRTENKLLIRKVSVPFGVVAVIFESRPNVAADTAALCLASGNVSILRGGKESFRSCHAIVRALKEGLGRVGLPEELINMVEDRSREGAMQLMRANGYVDLLIPRGGAGLIRACVENATVPCIETGTGICHIYLDREANFDMALAIVENAKTQRPSVCNAAEVLLVDAAIAKDFLPRLKARLSGVELRLCEKAASIIDGKAAGELDFDTEFLDYILAVKVVDGVGEAISHIAAHSTHHSEAIITENEETAEYFLSRVDSAAVYHNASTRFTDGGEFGNGCEIGISTQKLHARGPMGLSELNTYRYIIKGNGQIRG